MKKPKLDMAKVNGWFLHHVEKIVLVLVAAIACYVVYAGYSPLPSFDGVKAPDDLKKLSETSRTFISNPNNWEQIKEVRTNSVDLKLDVQLDKATAPNLDSAYRLPMPWKKPDFPRLAPRTDPKLFPPQNIKIVPVVGPLAYIDENATGGMSGEYGGIGASKTVDPLDPVIDEDEEEKKPKKKPKPKTKRPNRLLGEGSPAIEDEYLMPEGPGYPGGYPGMEGSGMVSNIAGRIHPEADRGYRPSMGAISKATQAMVVMAVVPYDKQFEEFEKSLSESLEYDPMRDSPRYLLFNVERADVTDDPAADPSTLEWKRLNTKAAIAEIANWAGVPAEISDPLYLDPIPGVGSSGGGEGMVTAAPMRTESYPGMAGGSGAPTHKFGVLTHPAPPFMLRDIWDLLTHPDVPLMQLTSAMESGMPGMPGRMGPGGRPLNPKGGKAFEEDDDLPGMGMPQAGMNSGYGGYGPPGYGSPGGMMPGGYGYGESGSGMIDPNIRPKYKLLRFTDTSVESGRKYRYRLKVFLEDPNYPSAAFRAPPPVSLDPTVQDRVKKQAAADAKRAATRPGYKTYWRESEWSEPSDVVALPSMDRFYAISADPPVLTSIFPDRPGVPNTQPDAKLLTVIWDPTKAADLAAEREIYRGSPLSFVADAWAVHPVKLEVRSIPKTEFKTPSIVADIQGGEAIPPLKRSSDPLKAPAEVLVVDSEGNLSVEEETVDIEEVRKFTPMPEPEKKDPMNPYGEGYDSLMEAPAPMPNRRTTNRRGREGGP